MRGPGSSIHMENWFPAESRSRRVEFAVKRNGFPVDQIEAHRSARPQIRDQPVNPPRACKISCLGRHTGEVKQPSLLLTGGPIHDSSANIRRAMLLEAELDPSSGFRLRSRLPFQNRLIRLACSKGGSSLPIAFAADVVGGPGFFEPLCELVSGKTQHLKKGDLP